MSQELTRLRAEVEKREQRDLERAEKYLKEHAELRAEIEALKKERSDIAAIASHQESTLAALRVLCAAKDEALKQIAKGEGAFNRNQLIHAENTIEAAIKTAKAALALTASSPELAGKVLCDGKEVEELRRDRERVDWLGNYYWDKFVVRFTSCADEKQLRAAIDAAMKP